MLAVAAPYRGHGIATALVKRAIDAMAEQEGSDPDEGESGMFTPGRK